jgi:hypothetical protein
MVGEAILVDGSRVAAGMRRLTWFAGTNELGCEVLGLPFVVAVNVTPFRRECFAEPAVVELKNGVSAAARLSRGSEVVVSVVHSAAGLREVWLRHMDSGELVRSSSARKQEGGQRNKFTGLRPGPYVVAGRDCEIVGGRIDLQAGGTHEVQVTIR